eukprot:CAMPEP_0172178912 /NCGR_PEP_ID=MMETSP1050-20130122/16311_1 /TAXON_ID=233186 /ORGANISM="Cryptomonas curvata, Strain CCAP979/52" /LENGTH=33 /DNA_ID= /DNA_START= /DNA_END= /DNA_ORIENTATION=
MSTASNAAVAHGLTFKFYEKMDAFKDSDKQGIR